MAEDRNNSGRVLRVKSGYNPNSSSIGSDIPAFLAAAACAGSVTVIIINILAVARDRILESKNDEPGEEDDD